MALETEPLPDGPDLRAGHELSDLPPGKIALFGAALAVVIILVVVVTYFLNTGFNASQRRREPPQSPFSFGPQTPPEPRLITQPGADFSSMRAAEKEFLSSYGWVDRDKGIAHIPIGEAIDILAQKGLRARAPAGAKQQQ
jgi:hypothetical protein